MTRLLEWFLALIRPTSVKKKLAPWNVHQELLRAVEYANEQGRDFIVISADQYFEAVKELPIMPAMITTERPRYAGKRILFDFEFDAERGGGA